MGECLAMHAPFFPCKSKLMRSSAPMRGIIAV
jgi:hypothetical protein